MQTTIESSAELIDKAEINGDKVLVQYTKTEAALAELRKKYKDATFDLTTTKGDKEARAARLELVTLRGVLEKRRKEFKKPALEFGQKIDAEAARITAEIKALETPIDEQIVADENRRATEKAERERIEAERIAGHHQRLAVMRSCATRAHGLPSARIANGIAQVEAIMLGVTAWEEFAEDAATAKDETLTAMRAMFNTAKAHEDEQARVEAQRLENERIAADNRAAAERLVEQQRALDEQAAALQAKEAERERILAEEAARLEREAKAAQREKERQAEIAAAALLLVRQQADVSQQGADAMAYGALGFVDNGEAARNAIASGDLGMAGVNPLTPQQAASRILAARLPEVKQSDNGARLTLGQINELLAPVSITVAGLASLGFDPVEQVKASRLYRECDLPAICAAISAHVMAAIVATTETD
jgi:hypothetical protein